MNGKKETTKCTEWTKSLEHNEKEMQQQEKQDGCVTQKTKQCRHTEMFVAKQWKNTVKT